MIGNRPRRWKVPQPPTRRGSWKGTGRRIIGQRAGHTKHLETEEVTRIKIKNKKMAREQNIVKNTLKN